MPPKRPDTRREGGCTGEVSAPFSSHLRPRNGLRLCVPICPWHPLSLARVKVLDWAMPRTTAVPMRRTRATVDVARALVQDPSRARWSYELAQELDMHSGPACCILKRMREHGWLMDYWETPSDVLGWRARRRYYKVTDMGRRKLSDLIGGTEEATSSCDPIAVSR